MVSDIFTLAFQLCNMLILRVQLAILVTRILIRIIAHVCNIFINFFFQVIVSSLGITPIVFSFGSPHKDNKQTWLIDSVSVQIPDKKLNHVTAQYQVNHDDLLNHVYQAKEVFPYKNKGKPILYSLVIWSKRIMA